MELKNIIFQYGKYRLNANANRYWTKAMEPVYPDHDMTPDEGS